jgi:hypothetical protein
MIVVAKKTKKSPGSKHCRKRSQRVAIQGVLLTNLLHCNPKVQLAASHPDADIEVIATTIPIIGGTERDNLLIEKNETTETIESEVLVGSTAVSTAMAMMTGDRKRRNTKRKRRRKSPAEKRRRKTESIRRKRSTEKVIANVLHKLMIHENIFPSN